MAKVLTPAELGEYGLITVTITFAIYLLGMDFYIYNTREILSKDPKECIPLIRDQIVFHGIVYAVVMPLLLIVFLLNIIPWEYIVLFYLILTVEHLSQEAYRLLITLSKPTYANVVLFLRSGAWAYSIIVLAFVNKDIMGIKSLLFAWLLGGISSLFVFLIVLKKEIKFEWGPVIKKEIDWKWIKKGFVTSLPFFFASITLKGVEFADRYFLKIFHGNEAVGIYTFYMSIANVLQVFVFTGIISILYPNIIKAYQDGEYAKYQRLMKKMGFTSILSSIGLIIVLLIVIYPILLFVDNAIYNNYIWLFVFLLIGITLNVASQIPHYALYVRREDKAILLSTIIAFLAVIIFNFILVPTFEVYGAGISTIIGMLMLMFMKLWFVRRRQR
ncbi:hypothetical protein GCM10010965_28830 [Caldalkalibacillus thermarum]|nr:hypothetical protein GCM10010965_28830 [Caldalkalibacillus thermarum]